MLYSASADANAVYMHAAYHRYRQARFVPMHYCYSHNIMSKQRRLRYRRKVCTLVIAMVTRWTAG